MDIALFTNGQIAIAGTSDGLISTFDPLIIFQDPDLFTKRFLHQFQSRFELPGFWHLDRIILALTGALDEEKKILIRSFSLNDLSRSKLYDGFDFNEALKGDFNENQIFLLNDAFACALGVCKSFENLILPCMVLSINSGVGVSFINNSNRIVSAEWGADFVPAMNKNIYEALGRESIYSILINKKIDVQLEYTENLIHTINYLSNKYAENNLPIKSVVVLGEKAQYVNEVMLKENLADTAVSVITDQKITNELILKGCFSYPEYSASKNGIIKIQYLAGQELLYDFESFEKCKQHYVSVKPLSNPDNYYKILFADGSVETVTMKSVNNVSELEKYSF